MRFGTWGFEMSNLIIDGSRGEGGGQILRSSLAISMISQRPICVTNIRKGRPKPGLMRQHLTAVQAAAQICNARVTGDCIGSCELTFEPNAVVPGEFRFSIGTAGSTTLVLQTILPALVIASGPSTLILEGGTHNPLAPPFDFLANSFLPLINRMGPQVAVELERHGFFPAGGGRFRVAITPTDRLRPLSLVERGEIVDRRAIALISHLSPEIARRELKVLGEKLGWNDSAWTVAEAPNSPGPGNVLFVEIETPQLTEVFTGFGERGIRAERVAERLVHDVRRYLAAEVPVGEYLADQLLLPLAMAGGGEFVTLPLSRHSTTQIELLEQLMDVKVEVHELRKDARRVVVRS